MRTRRALLDSATKALLHAANELSFPLRARLESELLLSFVLGVERIELHSHPEREVGEAEAGAFQSCIARRAKGEPIEYITKRASFYGRDFYVDSRVLIPRAESELLVDEARALIEAYGLRSIAEVGVGSGAVIGTLARFYPQCEFIGTDVSAEALAVARKNVGGDVALFHCSLLNFNSSLGVGHSACGDFLASASFRSLRRTLSAPHSLNSHSPKNSSAILECQGESLPKDSGGTSESTFSDSLSISESAPSVIASQALQSIKRASQSVDCHDFASTKSRNDDKTESRPLQNLESNTDSETPSGGVYLHRDKNKNARSADLEASSGWGIVKGEGATSRAVAKPQTHTCTFKPLPLNKKEKEILKNNRILEVKAKDSEKLDSESKIRAESAMTGDSEKWDLESEKLEFTTDSESERAMGVDCRADKSARNDDRLDSQSIDCHDFAPAESRNDKGRDSKSEYNHDVTPAHNDKHAQSQADSKKANCHAGLTPNEGKHTAESHNEDKTESSTMFAPQIQLIISNPPYIARDYPISAPLRYEPAIALFSGEDGLDMLRELIVEASRRGVWLLCEIGYDQRECLEQILEQSGAKEWRFYKDLSDFWRGFVARF